MVEMALILPLLLLLVAGILDIGRITFTYAHLQMAAQETVRKGGLGESDAKIKDFARNYVHFSDPDKLVVEINPPDTTRKSGNYIKVKLKYPIKFYTPLVSNLFSSQFYAETDSTIRVE
jgi:Flp pilus assembly protein TadG